MGDITKEPLLKKGLILLSLVLSITSIIFILIQCIMLNNIHKKQVILNQNIVGRLYNMNPEKELEIVKAVFAKEDEENYEVGKRMLAKYGYDTGFKAFEDDIFKDSYTKLIRYDFIICALEIALYLSLFIYGAKYFVKRIEDLSICIDKVISGDFANEHILMSEGILSRIEMQFYKMTRIIKNNIESMEKEKENIKALVSDISHQLKTPIASIKVFNSILSEDGVTEEERTEFINRGKDNINRLEWLVTSLVKISRLEAGLIEIRKNRGDIKSTIVEAVNQVYLRALEKEIEIDMDELISYELVYDHKWTKEAIFNVLENAVKYTFNKGKITIRLVELQYCIRIDIEDSGIGIEEEEINSIFKRFYRGRDKRIEESEGSGIGLYLTRKILETQGGSIIVSSQKEKGSVFNLFLQKC